MQPRRTPTSPVLILLLKDSATISIALEDRLTDEGFRVQPFHTCAAALDWIKDNRPDAAILDVSLNGEACRDLAIELEARGVPLLIHSARHRYEGLLEGFEHVEWLEKPCSFRLIVEALNRALLDSLGRTSKG
ncbi:MAG TPA: response regulator [Microvirga sp.]|jgi:DNA-binding response OmpR family regulator